MKNGKIKLLFPVTYGIFLLVPMSRVCGRITRRSYCCGAEGISFHLADVVPLAPVYQATIQGSWDWRGLSLQRPTVAATHRRHHREVVVSLDYLLRVI